MNLSPKTTDRFEDTNDNRLLKRLSDISTEPQDWLLPIEGYEKKPLVSLEEAVKPLVGIVVDVERKAFIARRGRRRPVDGLTLEESASIVLYTMEWQPFDKCLYFALNQSLRDKQRENLKPWFLYLKLFLTALNKLPSVSCNVYRGVKKNLIDEYEPKSTLIWWGFSSCTRDVGILQSEKFLGKTGDRTLFSVESYSGKNICRHSYYQYEHEILLPPACHFEVIARLDLGNNSHLIQLRETEPPVVLIEPVPIEANSALLEHDDGLGSSSSIINQVSKLEGKIDRYLSNPNVNLTFEDLTDDDVQVIVNQIVMFNVCTILDLSTNHITSQGVLLLAVALRENKTLKELSLTNNQVCDEGIRFLSETLAYHNSTLTTLGLGSNDATDTGARYLSQILRTNQTLEILTLPQNQITNQGIELLMDALSRSNRGLRILNVSSNTLVNDGCVESVAKMLNGNQMLRELYMVKCGLTPASVKRIQQLTRSRRGFDFHT